jgi:succinate dehydrogenase flavin-adding protein (antitoxin of CptAB toxin-antitoxin module)
MYEIELYDKYKEKHKQEFNRFLNKYERDLFKLKLNNHLYSFAKKIQKQIG